MPLYLASRGASEWSTQGLLPPASAGQEAFVLGWTPDYTEIFSNVSLLEAKKNSALIVQSISGGEPTQITPYVAEAEFFYAGQSQDGSVVLFESRSKLLDEAIEGKSNLYAWDRATGEVSLAGALNTDEAPPKGAFAGPYDWALGMSPTNLGQGGAVRQYYTQDTHAIAADGRSVYFTARGSGQLYLRRNPTEQQSALNGEGKCTETDKACTLHLSKTRKTNGKGPGGSDVAGTRPAAFMGATPDGSRAFFTSSEKLTNDANTGPEQKPAVIGWVK